MKTMKTKLTEQQFLDRLTRLCRQKERRDQAYAERDTFLFQRKQNHFWLGAHHAIGGKNPGVAAERLNASYRVEEDGLVTVSYRASKHPVLFLPYAIVGVLGLIAAISILADVLAHRAVSGSAGVTSLLFLGFFVAGFFGNAKELAALEDHLRYICGLIDHVEEAESVRPDLTMICDREVFPVRVRHGGRDYLTLSYCRADGEDEHLLHSADARELIYFRNRAQMDRFCAEHDLQAADGEADCDFDMPLSEDSDHGHVLQCWNLLHTAAQLLQIPFEGDDPRHDGLYEILFGDALPVGDVNEHRLEAEQVQELGEIFADKETLLAGFRMWRE